MRSPALSAGDGARAEGGWAREWQNGRAALDEWHDCRPQDGAQVCVVRGGEVACSQHEMAFRDVVQVVVGPVDKIDAQRERSGCRIAGGEAAGAYEAVEPDAVELRL